MRRLNVHPLRGAFACLSLVALLSVGGALAQTMPGAGGSSPVPVTLRLAQVVPRLSATEPGRSAIHLYALAQDEKGTPLRMRAGDLSALVASDRAPVELRQGREGIGLIFLIDVSASLSREQFEMSKASVRAWIDTIVDEDRAAIVTFGNTVNTVQDFTNRRPALIRALSELTPRNQRTLLYQALIQAIDMSRRLDSDLPLRRAIVVLTDGMDDQQGGAGRQEVIDKLEIDPTPIYGLGVSAEKRPAVDEALKQFSALVRLSGGDYRRVDLPTLDRGFTELNRIVHAAQHFTASCPACVPDGSTLNLRLFLEQGPTRLSSNTVRVRAVGEGGQIVQPKPDPKPEPKPDPKPEPKPDPKPEPKPEPKSWWQTVTEAVFRVPWQWATLLVLLLAGAAAGLLALLRPAPVVPSETRVVEPTTPTTPHSGEVSGPVKVSSRLLVSQGTQRDRQRLRLYPLGHNELQAKEVLFEGELAIGRSPDNDICIYNDSQVSGHHCTLSPDNGLILVRDQGSRNGTRVNRVPIEGTMHAEADSILGVGRTELRMQLLPAGTS